MCCPGCLAVAQLIATSGLQNFYQQRTAFNQRPNQAESETTKHYQLYNDPEINRSFTRQGEHGITHARLLIGGITCAACTWLIEQSLCKLHGVKTATVNLGFSVAIPRDYLQEDSVRLSIYKRIAEAEEEAEAEAELHSEAEAEEPAAADAEGDSENK